VVYLVATHFSTLCIFAMFALLHGATGSFALEPLARGTDTLRTTAVFVLALLGFGLKAGLMPLHFWLPPAHASAPSHVSALLSGVVLKMGVYGMVRTLALLPDPPSSWGALLLVLGAVSGILGVAFAIGQHDMKRLLAYHSVENIGIIFLGLGLATAGRALGRPDLVALGLAGCLLHVWNHGFFKALLFLAAGAVVRTVGTREIGRMGGLARRMPATGALFLVGAVAICGLPPLNGFVSELLVYLGLFRALVPEGGPSWAGAALAAPVLASIGALAVACFVKVHGAAFLGEPRSERAARAREAPATMLAPMGILALCCAAIGVAPSLAAPLLDRAASAWAPGLAAPAVRTLAPLGAVGLFSAVLAAAAVAGFALLPRRRALPAAGTWDCGYARPTARMQYTASSFAQPLVKLLSWALRPHARLPRVRGAFPGASSFESHVHDPILRGLLVPSYRALKRRLEWFRRFQRGPVQHYLLFILAAVVLLSLCTLPLGALLSRMFGR
jgi:hydrogenase-4 component B